MQTQPGIPPLAVRQLYEVAPDGSIGRNSCMAFAQIACSRLSTLLETVFFTFTADFRGELRRLNRELLFAYAEMLGAVSAR